MIIPGPAKSARTVEGTGADLRELTTLFAPAGWMPEASVIAADIVADGGPRLVLRGADASVIVRRVAATELMDVTEAMGVRADGDNVDERYRMRVADGRVEILAVSAEGAFRGLTTLRQLVTAARGQGRTTLDAMEIVDGPRFAWRGLSLDVARTFHPVAQVERVIDMLSLLKLNVLHLHLTDDQGWRLQIPDWPRLHELGGSQAQDGRTGDSYTDADLRHLVAYGRARHVVLVPEVDMPGHFGAAASAYPDLGTSGEHGSLLAIGSPRARDFIHSVIGHEAELFDAAYVHIGADEAFGMPSEAYQQYVSEARDAVTAVGRRVVGWQEHARAGATPDSVVQLWIEPGFLAGMMATAGLAEMVPPELLEPIVAHVSAAEGDLEAATSQGARILLSLASHIYFDRPIAEASLDPDQETRRGRLGMPVYPPLSLPEIATRDPLAAVPGLDPATQVAGLEAAMWCETVLEGADLELLLMPRLAGLAEISWGDASRSWSEHARALAAQAPAWDQRGWNYLRASTVAW